MLYDWNDWVTGCYCIAHAERPRCELVVCDNTVNRTVCCKLPKAWNYSGGMLLKGIEVSFTFTCLVNLVSIRMGGTQRD